MSTNTVISLNKISKVYKRYNRPIDRLKELLVPGKSIAEEFWALRNISLEIQKGKTVGIIGRNGSGKSTLLQIIAGTLQPSEGTLYVNGRVSALLELGSGFNPEFTGRQNVFFNGRILGMLKEEIENRFDDIAAFADIGGFIDQPVKTYSSGMFVRLAFATAIYVNPDILIVDEALAVGDFVFQTKCMTRMRYLMESGVTILFVSHDTSTVKSICSETIHLKDGQVYRQGKSGEVVDLYIKESLQEAKQIVGTIKPTQGLAMSSTSTISKNLKSQFENFEKKVFLFRQGDGRVKIKNVMLTNRDSDIINKINFGETLYIRIYCLAQEDLSEVVVAFYIKDKNQIEVVGTNTVYEDCPIYNVEKGELFHVDFSLENLLKSGAYSLTVLIADSLSTKMYYDWVDNAANFMSHDLPGKTVWSQVLLPTECSTQRNVACLLQVNNLSAGVKLHDS